MRFFFFLGQKKTQNYNASTFAEKKKSRELVVKRNISKTPSEHFIDVLCLNQNKRFVGKKVRS